MKKALKELIAEAPMKEKGTFQQLMFVSNGVYDGFWGKNGYDNIMILGYDAKDKKWYKVSDKGDVFNIFGKMKSFNLDIESKYGAPTIWFNNPIHIDNSDGLSTITGKIVDCRK